GWHSLLVSELPDLFRCLPETMHERGVSHYLMPAPGWFVRERFEGKVEHLAGRSIASARVTGSRVELDLVRRDGAVDTFIPDHVIAPTGYLLDLDRLSIFDEGLRRALSRVGGSPRLSAHFESSQPGLYFMGPLAANSFGPAMRFVLGARFAVRRIARHVA